ILPETDRFPDVGTCAIVCPDPSKRNSRIVIDVALLAQIASTWSPAKLIWLKKIDIEVVPRFGVGAGVMGSGKERLPVPVWSVQATCNSKSQMSPIFVYRARWVVYVQVPAVVCPWAVGVQV